MASDIWLRTILIVRKETRCRHIGYSFWLTARVLLYAPSHRQADTYHGLCYTSRGALAGTRNSSMGPPYEGSIRWPIAPWANALPLSYVPLLPSQEQTHGITSTHQTSYCRQSVTSFCSWHVNSLNWWHLPTVGQWRPRPGPGGQASTRGQSRESLVASSARSGPPRTRSHALWSGLGQTSPPPPSPCGRSVSASACPARTPAGESESERERERNVFI